MAYQSLPHHSRRKNKILVNTLVILGIVIILCIYYLLSTCFIVLESTPIVC